MRHNSKRAQGTGVLEKLEARTLLSAALDGDVLTILGNTASNLVKVDLVNGTRLDVTEDGVVTSFAASDVNKILFRGGSGGDKFELAAGLAIPVEAYGGIGRDILKGGDGADSLFGGRGADQIYGGDGTDLIRGGIGDDRILAGGKVDTIYGGDGNDSINSGAGDDLIVDNSGVNEIDTGAANTFQPMFTVDYEPQAFLSNVIGYDPAQIRRAYNLGAGESTGAYWSRGAGQTIYIVNAFSGRDPFGDLVAFSQQFDLPLPTADTFQIINEGGRAPAQDAEWGAESDLDIQWAHAIAPGAKIVLVQADSSIENDLFRAVRLAGQLAQENGGGVVSMSWGRAGGGAWTWQSLWDDMFRTYPKATFFAAAGNHGGVSAPAISPYVTAVGGTTLTLDSEGNRAAEEAAWDFTGAGLATDYHRPAYQRNLPFRMTIDGIDLGTDARALPDVVMNADPNTPYAIFSSTPIDGNTGWFTTGGTSAAAPQWAAIVALANQRRALAGQPVVGNNLNGLLYDLYNQGGQDASSSPFHDIITGSSVGMFDAFPGFDLATGLGAPNGDVLINALAGTETFYIQKGFEFTAKLQLPTNTPTGNQLPRFSTLSGQPRAGHGFMTGGDLLSLEFTTDMPDKFYDPDGVATQDEYFDVEAGQFSLDTVTLFRSGRGQTTGAIYGVGTATIFNVDSAYVVTSATFTLKFEGSWWYNADGTTSFNVSFTAVDPATYDPIPSGPFQLDYNPLRADLGAYYSGELWG